MALTKKPSATSAQFEAEPGAEASSNEAVATATAEAAPAEEITPSAKVTATTAIATAASTAVGAVNNAGERAKQFKRDVEAMKGASSFDYGNYTVFKGKQGEIRGEDGGTKLSLGRWAKVRLIAWDEHYEVSPGEQSASSKDFVAYSKDGITIDSVIGEELRGEWTGRKVADYVNYLITEEEFKKASSRHFIDTACALLATDSGKGPIGTVIQVTLSKSSIPAFSKYQQQLNDTARCVEMNLPGFALPEDPFTFYFVREAASKGDNEWTKLKVVAQLPNDL